MSLNALDILFIVILLVTLILGLIKGIVRGVIGLMAVIAGLILAAHYYARAGLILHAFISSAVVSNFIGFLVIFAIVLFVGWLIGFLLSKLMKGPLAFMNHLLGGLFGILKGFLICGVLVLALLVFDIGKEKLVSSRLAPFCFQATQAIIRIIPRELKEKFKSAYEGIRGSGVSHGQKV